MTITRRPGTNWTTLQVPVEAKVISAIITHHPIERYREEGGEWGKRPERLAGVVKVRFRFGGKRIVTTKAVRFSHEWTTRLGWARDRAVDPSEVAAARETIERVLRDKVSDHGLTLDDDFTFQFVPAKADADGWGIT